MRGHLYNQFLSVRLPVLSCFGMQVLALILVVISGEDISAGVGINASIILPYLFFLISNSVIFHYGESEKWCYFAASTPQAARGQVTVKYLFSLGVNATILIMPLIVCAVVSTFSGENLFPTMRTGLLFFGVSMILCAFEYPFYFRFGSTHGAQIKATSIMLVFVILLIYGLFGDVSFIVENADPEALLGLMDGTAFRTLSYIMPAISLALFAVSYFISVPLYRKGMECYEQ